MSPGIVALVLLAALLHASWNAIIKVRGDRLSVMALMAAGSAGISLACIAFVPLPRPAAWPWLAASALAHIGYRIFLTKAYDHGDLSQVYPLARGAAPLIVALLSAVVAGEVLGPKLALGVAVLAGGIMLLTFENGVWHLLTSPHAVGLSLLTACFITSYTLFDGLGARANGHAFGYTVWLMVLDGIPLIAYVAIVRGRDFGEVVRDNWRPGFVAAGLSFAAYAIVIWAMTQGPIAPVAALRETSIVIAAVIGSVAFGERFGPARWAAVLCVAAGMMIMRF